MDLVHGQRVQYHRPDGILIFAAGLLVLAVDGPANVEPVSVQIAYTQAQQFSVATPIWAAAMAWIGVAAWCSAMRTP